MIVSPIPVTPYLRQSCQIRDLPIKMKNSHSHHITQSHFFNIMHGTAHSPLLKFYIHPNFANNYIYIVCVYFLSILLIVWILRLILSNSNVVSMLELFFSMMDLNDFSLVSC